MKRKIYAGSVKDIYEAEGPGALNHLVFEFSDAFSVFDWGRMPNEIPGKGEALARLSRQVFQAVQAKLGIPTHLSELADESSKAFRVITVRKARVDRPSLVAGRWVYPSVSNVGGSELRLVPLEAVFRFGAPAGSSILSEPGVKPWDRFETPRVEFSTKLEPTDRKLSRDEAFEISGITSSVFSELAEKTLVIARFLRQGFQAAGLELWDGKLEWAHAPTEGLVLVDAVGPDELRLTPESVPHLPLSKEYLRQLYRPTDWYRRLNEVKKQFGTEADWKSKVGMTPPRLKTSAVQLIAEMYQVLCDSWNVAHGSRSRVHGHEKLFFDLKSLLDQSAQNPASVFEPGVAI